jgi:hypothetical protein
LLTEQIFQTINQDLLLLKLLLLCRNLRLLLIELSLLRFNLLLLLLNRIDENG